MASARSYWNTFYKGDRSRAVPGEATTFARWASPHMSGPPSVLAEFGFGNGRDSLHFARSGHVVRGFDFAASAVAAASNNALTEELDAVFTMLDLGEESDARVCGEHLDTLGSRVTIYGRFFIHSLDETARSNFFDLIAMQRTHGCDLLLEFRTGSDEAQPHVFGDDHLRVFLDPDDVVAELEGRGVRISERVEGHGLAPFRDEDPHVCRLVGSLSAADA